MRLKHVFLITLFSLCGLLAVNLLTHAQRGGRQGHPRLNFTQKVTRGAPKQGPMVGENNRVHPSMTRMAQKKGRVSGPTQTVDLTPNTPTVTDQNPFWTRDETRIYFDSNRSALRPTDPGFGAGSLFHIYSMPPNGGTPTAITGPLSQGAVGANASQMEAAANAGASEVVYIERSGTGSAHLITLSLVSRTTKNLTIAAQIQGVGPISFNDLNHPEYFGSEVVFAGQEPGQPFHIYSINIQTGFVTRYTSGVSDNRNPTLDPDTRLIAFDSNRANAAGTAINAGSRRDVWIMPVTPNQPPSSFQKFTNFSANGTPSSNIEPTWSTNKTDLGTDPDGNPLIGGQQMIAFSSNRVDSQNNGNPDAIGSSHDIYYLFANIASGGPGVFAVGQNEGANFPAPGDPPGGPFTGPPNTARKLNTSDPLHRYDDRNAAWPQFRSTYRIAYHTDRTFYNAITNDSGPAGQPYDIFASTILDLNAPTLVRFDAGTGEIVKVTDASVTDPNGPSLQPNRYTVPGNTVRFWVRIGEFESSIRDVYIQIKNPNSKYQNPGGDNQEHKSFLLPSSPAFSKFDGTNFAIDPPIEWECQRIFADPTSPSAYTYADPVYAASVSDFFAFSGNQFPPNPGWLPLSIHRDGQGNAVRDADGNFIYTGTWRTDRFPSDYYLDVIVYDTAVDPFDTSFQNNWKIYDNVWGFTTQAFTANSNILFVSDYALGQKFFQSKFGLNVLSPSNTFFTFYGTESWMTDIDVSLLPNRYLPVTPGGTGGRLGNVLNPLGVKSYGASASGSPANDFFATIFNFDSDVIDGTVIDGADLPVTQRYDIWRILSRGPIPDSVLLQYQSRLEPQEGPVPGSPRTVRVAPRCVIWHSPFAGTTFTGPGNITDLAVQSQLISFVNSGGRLLVNGQDIAWALTLNGFQSNSFVNNVLKVTFNTDQDPRVVGGPPGWSSFYGLTPAPAPPAGTPDSRPISWEPWAYTPSNLAPPPGSAGHVYPGPPFPPGYNSPQQDPPLFLADGTSPVSTDAGFRSWGAPSNQFPDMVTAAAGVRTDFFYGGTTQAAICSWQDPGPEADQATGSGGRVVYSPCGLEGIVPDAFAPPNPPFPPNLQISKNRRAEILHNAVCWMRTGTVFGTIRETEGAQPLAGVLVRIVGRRTTGAPPQDIPGGFAITDDNGNYEIRGVEADDYEVFAEKLGFLIQRSEAISLHGGWRTERSLLMTKANPATIRGKVTRMDGTTPIPGATVTATSLDPRNPVVLTAETNIDGDYVFSRVPAFGTYRVEVTAAPTGFAVPGVPAFIIVPTPPDPNGVQPATEYPGIDFRLRAIPGVVTGQVVDVNTGAPIAGAVVVATQGSTTTQVIADSNGVYRFDNLDPGAVSIVASAPGYVASTGVTVTVISGQTLDTTTNPELRIRLTPAAPGTIRGLVVRNTDGQPVAGVTVTLHDPAGNQVASTTSFLPARTADGKLYNFEFTNVPSGVRYTIRVRMTGFTAIPGEFTTTLPLTPGGTIDGVNFTLDPLHTFPAALSLVSAPFDYPNSDVADLLSIPQADRLNQNRFKFATWDLGRYVFYPTPPANTFRLGRGYFLGYVTNMALSTEGTPANPNLPFDVTLNPGWNMLGNPFWKDASGQDIVIDWLKVDVVLPGGAIVTHDQAVSQGLISNALYGYVAGTYALEFSIQPWRGYWVRAFQNVTLRIDPINDRLNRSATLKDPVTRAAVMGPEGWTVNLRMSAGGLHDGANYLGVSSRAVDGYDRYKAEKPPIFNQDYAYLTFDHDNWGDKSGGYGVDVRSSGLTTKVWEVTARTSVVNATASVGWPDVAGVPRNVQLTLTDLATGTKRDMRTSSSYQWNTGDQASTRRFRIEATGTTINYGLRITSVVGRGVGRNAGVAISYNLSAPADVEVRILGSNGAAVRKLTGRSTRAAGLNQATWDQKNDAGVAMPAGAYIVEIRAQSADGKQSVRAAQPILVVR